MSDRSDKIAVCATCKQRPAAFQFWGAAPNAFAPATRLCRPCAHRSEAEHEWTSSVRHRLAAAVWRGELDVDLIGELEREFRTKLANDPLAALAMATFWATSAGYSLGRRRHLQDYD